MDGRLRDLLVAGGYVICSGPGVGSWGVQQRIKFLLQRIRGQRLASWWRSVGERRLRYGVEIPAKSTAGRWQSPPVAAGLTGAVAAAVTPPLSSAQAPAAAPVGYAAKAEDDEEDGDDQLVGAMATDHSGPRAFIETCTLVDYFQAS